MEQVSRSMKIADIEQVYEIETEAFTTPWTAQAFYNELMNNQFAKYIVMEVEGNIAAYGGMWAVIDEAHITNIAVRKKYRGQKMGEMLLQKMIQMAVDLGMKKMTLEVRVSNHIAIHLYKKFGFYESGIRKGYYTDNNEDALIMWIELEQKEGTK
ncbi:ribosomal protein S18-alanine N-acetyltransferase [Chengkuizengella axinellae]|uniref:[Ribosomal protein bS18]-alanine N-acetyltransferase n=1 Tax=Chengkuizengella axinellae TaxID=3064388 RepID=A0ABT9J4X2_9BACL|nr:ribosomal protein S18-alanine N-acetyltransferase [Chengkuizengella sp. 2205SS18-9]MDP5276653.1 ribosomal protein S18-alanine N-acetyltransferase [Chengkuizengella sp. 2205SS18-9]